MSRLTLCVTVCVLCADSTCVNSVSNVAVNGKPAAMGYRSYPGGSHTFQVHHMGLAAESCNGASVCWDLLPACPTLNSFCTGGVCDYAMYNAPKTCCPVGVASY